MDEKVEVGEEDDRRDGTDDKDEEDEGDEGEDEEEDEAFSLATLKTISCRRMIKLLPSVKGVNHESEEVLKLFLFL